MFKEIRKIVFAASLIALGLVLPFFTAQVPALGQSLLPMHIPVLLSGFLCGGPLGALVGFITPLLRSYLFGMPLLFPGATVMAFELATYGFFTGYLRKLPTLLNLILSMLAGRLVWGLVRFALLGFGTLNFSWQIFVAGAFVNALPGIILQIILIPILVEAFKKSNMIN
ncbi:MAG: ECF transporter S component [Bacillota bacterium]|nr:ECF transporter S component [Bacillota bacterium]HHU61946.1 ECF transporter S component [Natronincola sp.]